MSNSKLRLHLGLAALTAGSLFSIPLAQAPASADTIGCSSSVVDKRDDWYREEAYWGARDSNPTWLLLTARSYYQFCHNGEKVNKIRPYKWRYCYEYTEKKAGSDWTLDKVNFNSSSWDQNEVRNPKYVSIIADEPQKACQDVIIGKSGLWFEMTEGPRWMTNFSLKLNLQQDIDGFFWSNYGDWKPYVPANDVNVSNAYN